MTDTTLSSLRIRPCRFGLGVVVITGAMLLAAINYGNNLIFLLTFAMLAMIANSAWQGWRALASVRVHPLPPAMRPAGIPGEWTLQLISRQGLPALSLVVDDDRPATHASLPAGEQTRVMLSLAPAPRGYLHLPEVRLVTSFPLGLWRVERRLKPAIGQWVHPSPIAGPSHDVQLEHDSETGSHRDPGGDPTHLRAYQPGDPMRRIVFRHYAKTGRLVSRETEGEPQPIEPVVIDYNQYRGSTEVRLSAMTQRLLTLSERGEPWTLHLPGTRPIGSSSASSEAGQVTRQALRSLARFERRQDAMGYDQVPPGTGGTP